MGKTKVLGIDQLIKNYRKEKNMSQADFAKLFGKSQVMISYYEKRTHFPQTAEELKRLSEILDIQVSEVVAAIRVARSGVIEEYEPLLIDLNKLSNDDLLEKYNFVLEGEPIPDEIVKEMLDYLKYKHSQYKEQEK